MAKLWGGRFTKGTDKAGVQYAFWVIILMKQAK